MNITEEQPLKEHDRMFKLHDSESVCKLFLDACRRYDSGQLTESEFTQKCIVINDDAERLCLIGTLKSLNP